jgi:hypothetical protein
VSAKSIPRPHQIFVLDLVGEASDCVDLALSVGHLAPSTEGRLQASDLSR